MGRLPRAAGSPLPPLPPLLLLLLLLAGGASLGMHAVGSEEPGSEGLPSTSLLDLLLPTGLEPLDSEEPSEAVGLGAGLGAPGSGFPSEESEESRVLQPPQYFWEEEDALNESSLGLGPTADYVFPDLTEKSSPTDNMGQSQETPSLPSPLPGVDLVGPPWHVAPGEEEEEEEQLLPVTRPQEDAQRQAPGFPPTGSSRVPGPPEHRPEESGDQAASGGEAGSSMEPGLSPPRVSLSPVTLRGQDVASRGAGPTVLPATGRGSESEVPLEPGAEAAAAAVGLAGQPGVGPSPASFPQTVAPGGAEGPGRDTLQPGASASLPLAPGGTELTPSSVTLGRDDLRQEPQEGPAGAAPSRRPWDSTQVICKDWSDLAGKSYVVLSMTENADCEAFRRHRGLQLLALVEGVLPRHGRGRHGAWHISLSKPSEKEQHLLMALVGEHGVVPTQDVLSMLGDIRRSLEEIGIRNYSATGSCAARAGRARGDYGTLFVVLVVIGALCVLIIALGLLYNCWQRRLPKLKHVSHGEELRFVENGCHDNPTLDVASDSQSEMQEKQPSLNGGGAVNGPGGWSALMGGKRDPEDLDVFEEDTHL